MRFIFTALLLLASQHVAFANDWGVRPTWALCTEPDNDSQHCTVKGVYYNRQSGEAFSCNGILESRFGTGSKLRIQCWAISLPVTKGDFEITPATQRFYAGPAYDHAGMHETSTVELFWITGPNKNDLRICEDYSQPPVCSGAPDFSVVP
jgi:hypothetical protein